MKENFIRILIILQRFICTEKLFSHRFLSKLGCVHQRTGFCEQSKCVFPYYNLPSIFYRWCCCTPLVIVLTIMGDLLSKLACILCKTTSTACAMSENMLTEIHTSVISDIYKIQFWEEKRDYFHVFQHQFSYRGCRMFQPRTELYIGETEMSRDHAVTDD